MTTGNPIGKAKAVTQSPSTEDLVGDTTPNPGGVDGFPHGADGFATVPTWRTQARKLARAATGLDPDHSTFTQLTQEIALENAYEKMRQQGRALPSGIAALRSLVKPPRTPLAATSVPAVPTLQELLELSYTDWIDPQQRPNLLQHIRDLYTARRTELEDLTRQYRTELTVVGTDSVATVERIHLVERRLIELDHETQALDAHEALLG